MDNQRVMDLEVQTVESTIKLPVFTGEPQHWDSFQEIFTELVMNNEKLSTIMKFQHLLNSLEGEAFDTIRGIQVLESNFDLAWETLTNRYDNSSLRFEFYAETLVELPSMEHESLNHIQYLLNVANGSAEVFKSMDLPVGEWDRWMVFFVERKLCLKTRREWQKVVEKEDDYPSYETFKEFLENKIVELVREARFAPDD